MSDLTIRVRDDHELVLHAARELQRYGRRLFGSTPVVAGPGAGQAPSRATVLLGGHAGESLSEQGYLLKRVTHQDRPALVVAGGSPRATLWAAYELVSLWGVHYLVQGDLWPAEGQLSRLPELPNVDLRREPTLERREFRVINDMANSGIFWGIADHERLFDQLVKLRFTGVLIQTYAHQPWAHYRFRGVERSSAGLCYGWRHPIHSGTIGAELLTGTTHHTNPEFVGAETYEEQLACGRRLMRGIFTAAQRRGLEITYFHPLSEVPDEFVAPLEEHSRAVALPRAGFAQPHFSRHGLTYSGGSGRVEGYRTPLNPVFVELMETALVAHMRQYPDADRYGLTEQEFPPAGVGVEECWQALDRKYHLESRLPLAGILDRAREQEFYGEGRALRHAMGAIQTLRLVDILVTERDVLRHAAKRGARMAVNFFSEHVQPAVAHVFDPERCEFWASIDYLPARAAERMDTLAFAADTDVAVTMVTTVEDDNVGFLPQANAAALHATVAKMREYGLRGYSFRQFDISQHEPAMAYLIEAAWDAAATPEQSYRRFAEAVAGSRAAGELIAVLHELEQLTEASNALMGLGFMFPNLYRKHWMEGLEPEPEWRAYLGRLTPIRERCSRALQSSNGMGRGVLARFSHFLAFAGEHVVTLDLIRQARRWYDRAQAVRRAGEDHLRYHELIGRAAQFLAAAQAASERALTRWTQVVADPTDAGTLAGLNAYGHDWLRGKAVEVGWESQCYGYLMEAPAAPEETG